MAEIRGTLKLVDINNVYPNDYNPNEMTPDLMAKEAEAFKRFGVIRSVLVRQVGKYRWSIVDGEHRYRIQKEAGMTHIQVRDLGKISDEEAQTLTVVLNEIRGQNDFVKSAELFASIKSFTPEDIASFLPYKPVEIQTMTEALDFDFSEYGRIPDPFAAAEGSAYATITCRIPKDECAALDSAVDATASKLGIDDKKDAIKLGRVFAALLKDAAGVQ